MLIFNVCKFVTANFLHSKNDESNDDDGNTNYYNAKNPKLLKNISSNHSLLSSILTESILNSLKERDVQRDKLLKQFTAEYLKNDKGTMDFCESAGDPIKFYFENYDTTEDVTYRKRIEDINTRYSLRDIMKNLTYYTKLDDVVNDDFKSVSTLMNFIKELNTFASHFDGLKHTLKSFQPRLMHLIDLLENNYNYINEDEVQQAKNEKNENNEKKTKRDLFLHTHCDVEYEKYKPSLTVYQQRKRLIELAVVYVHDFMDVTMTRYIDSYEEIKNDYGEKDYRDDETIKDFIQNMKCVHGAVTDALGEILCVEHKLKEITAKLVTNHGET